MSRGDVIDNTLEIAHIFASCMVMVCAKRAGSSIKVIKNVASKMHVS